MKNTLINLGIFAALFVGFTFLPSAAQYIISMLSTGLVFSFVADLIQDKIQGGETKDVNN